MESFTYTFKTGLVGSTPVLVSITASGLVRVQGGKATVIPLDDVASVRLWLDPALGDFLRYRCRIRSRTGETISVCSSSTEGLVTLKPQKTAYRAWVEALHRALSSRGAEVKFTAGRGRLSYALSVGIFVITLTVLVATLRWVGFEGLKPLPVAHLIVLALGVPLGMKWLLSNRPRSYHPAAIPAGLLPDGVAPAPRAPPAQSRRYVPEDFGPIAEPGDASWCSVGGNTTHWADAIRYAEEANSELDAGLIPPPDRPPPCPPPPRRQLS